MLQLLSQLLGMTWKINLKHIIYCLSSIWGKKKEETLTSRATPQNTHAGLVKRSLSFSCPLKALMF